MNRERFPELDRVGLAFSLGSHAVRMRSWGHIGPRPWRNYLHVHSFYEVCYAYAGQGVFAYRSREHQVVAGDLFVARPGNPHEIRARPEDPLGIYFWSYTLTTGDGVADDEIDALVNEFRESEQIISRRVPDMEATICLMTEEIGRREAGYRTVLEGLATKLLLDTCRAVAAKRADTPSLPPLPTPDGALAEEIVVYLHDNAHRPVSARDVSAQVHLSERHTNRVFRRVMGTSIGAYLRAYRLDTAAHLLLDGTLSIKAIAQRVGYHDVHYFTSEFHRRHGLPPAAFRRQHGTRFLGR